MSSYLMVFEFEFKIEVMVFFFFGQKTEVMVECMLIGWWYGFNCLNELELSSSSNLGYMPSYTKNQCCSFGFSGFIT